MDGVYALTAPNASKLVEIDGTVTRLSVRGRAAYGTAGDAVYIAGTATVNRVDLDLDLDKSASAFTTASGATVDAVSLKHLFQTGTTTNMVNLGHATNTVVSLGNVETNATTLVRSSGTGGNMRVRGGAIRAANGSVVGLVKTGSSGVKVNCPSFPVDQSILTPDDGDIVNNTNATPLNGTGPAIYNTAATKWKNLYSGTTS